MAEHDLSGKKVAILVAHGFEQVELLEPRAALEEAGAEVHIVSPVEGKVKGWDHDHWDRELDVDVHLAEARAEDYDAALTDDGNIFIFGSSWNIRLTIY